ncbi:MAG: tyrosine-type recombinase/integrase [Deltaproteobacteria bacterium]|nr:tyrosine-type recombinase/integrase [Deltaproteobacteria bacterium]
MSALQRSLDDYLKLRRALGFKLESTEWCLRGFVDFLGTEGSKHITTELALRWARRPPNGDPFTWAQRLSRIRLFAAWCRGRDPRTEVPDQGLLAASVRRKPPFIFSEEQIANIVREAEKLPCRRGMRSSTLSTMFGLLAVAGLRISEAIALDRTDVDLQEGQLAIRNTKFGKNRLVPVSTSTVAALRRYAKQRDRALTVVTTPAFFVSERGWRITDWATRYNFAKVSRAAGLRAPAEGYRHGHGPRVHDLRHSFAARTMVAWYRAGVDVERELPKLSAYLGHAHVNDTYWYIEAVPELLQLATERVTGQREGGRR